MNATQNSTIDPVPIINEQSISDPHRITISPSQISYQSHPIPIIPVLAEHPGTWCFVPKKQREAHA
jgi:hypothetical protein